MKDYCCWFDPRFEADDLIATLSAEAGDWPVAVYSSDKDLNPLLLDGPRAQLEKVDRVRNRMQWATPDSVFKKHGVRIEQFQEFLCLTGDDDIKGVPKIGKKTACQILEKYGTVERAMEVFDVEDLPCQKSRFESLQAAYESGHWAKLCEALKLRRDAPIPQNVRETLQQASSYVGMIPRLTVARVVEAFQATDKPERPF
jgi:5'-3' exonuclease